MIKNVLQYLEKATDRFPEKVIFSDEKNSMTYKEFLNKAQQVGSYLAKLNARNKPIAVFIDKSVINLTAVMGVVYSGNFYVIMDTEMPKKRANIILETLKPIAIITDETKKERITEFGYNGNIVLIEEAIKAQVNVEKLLKIRNEMIDTDPLYTLFTSGSTGVPKGTVICHRSVIAYAEWVTNTFRIDENTIFGNQTPFYFSMSVLDIFSTIKNGATLHIIPKKFFSFPIKLLEYMKEKKINTIYWVPSALCIVANWKALELVSLPDLKKILFAGEVMPTKQLNIWRKHIPDALYANLYGPTEITDICTYYVVDREISDRESLPIGRACDNCNVIIIKEDGTEAKKGEEGELCVRGSFLAMGYYNNPEKTQSVFVQNPLNPYYPELIYKTGDIVKYNEKDEIIYMSRKDFQIKHMGYRIELGEIETAINSIDGIIACAAVYNIEKSRIVLFYQSNELDQKNILEKSSNMLPKYMQPNDLIQLEKMPYNANGKIDRVALKNKLKEE